ncbi:MAG TPA: DNA-directed RNA polymerase subunit N, partial [Nitrososphaera sp.]|nr:DNA-directed RNA polymerase subunit N [Nitrososphaera sp.]
MLIPVRCFTCGGLIADKHAEYSNRVRTGEDPAKVMDSLGLKRYCCRRMFISNV